MTTEAQNAIQSAFAKADAGAVVYGDAPATPTETPTAEVAEVTEVAPDGASAEAPEAPATEPVAPEVSEPSIEIDGATFTAKEIRDMKTAAAKAADLESQLAEASSDRERLSIWRQQDALAEKYPALREKLAEVYREFEADPSKLGQPIEPRVPTQEERILADLVEERVMSQINSVVGEFAEYDAVQFKSEEMSNPDSPTRVWMRDVLGPEVQRRFGDGPEVGPDHIRWTLQSMVVEKGALKTARDKGAADVAAALAKQPPGTRIVAGPSTRKDGEPPKPNFKGKSIDEMFKAAGIERFVG